LLAPRIEPDGRTVHATHSVLLGQVGLWHRPLSWRAMFHIGQASWHAFASYMNGRTAPSCQLSNCRPAKLA
jgi:hypothetical protein